MRSTTTERVVGSSSMVRFLRFTGISSFLVVDSEGWAPPYGNTVWARHLVSAIVLVVGGTMQAELG